LTAYAGERKTLRMKQHAAQQPALYERFRALHSGPAMFVMPNAWDGASAAILKRAGFEALGSSSAAIAWAMGRQDGLAAVSRDEAIANAALLGAISGLPVNGDLEDGFGASPDDCVATVEASIAGGLAGLGIEDTTANPASPIHDFDHAVARIAAAAKAARGRILLTARTDLLIHGSDDVDEAIRRLTAFAEAGADVLYATGLGNMADVHRAIAAVSPKPVNVHVSATLPLAELKAAGAGRISWGAALYGVALAGLDNAAKALAAGDQSLSISGLSNREVGALLPGA
jgi:2-methylisocitrate lyase-like PEP mutase family enzyme